MKLTYVVRIHILDFQYDWLGKYIDWILDHIRHQHHTLHLHNCPCIDLVHRLWFLDRDLKVNKYSKYISHQEKDFHLRKGINELILDKKSDPWNLESSK